MAQNLLTLALREALGTRDEHQRVFLSRYAALHAYARRLAKHDRALADDLIQDAYIQFTSARPDLQAIRNLDGYLAALVRHLHVSWIRRTAAHRPSQLEIQDYDSADLALALSGAEQGRARHALVRVCEYACLRKDTSKAACVLLLRFFHGFYPSEVAQILRSTPRVVHDWLWKARREARAFLDDSIRGFRPPSLDLHALALDQSVDLISNLQHAILSTSRPPCLTPQAIAALYSRAGHDALDLRTFSHVASCRTCLDRVCAKLGIAGVGERQGEDEASQGEGGGPGTGSGASHGPAAFERRARRRARDLREHRPRQLQISVNGHQVGVLDVESARNAVRWTVRIDEPIAFAEVHSEQGLRMALLHVELPPDGELTQAQRIALSDDRQLSLALDFSELHPAVALEYVDPSLYVAASQSADAAGNQDAREQADELAPHVPSRSRWARLRDWWRRPARLWEIATIGHRVRAIALVVGLAVGAAGWLSTGRVAVMDANALITEAIAKEASAVPPLGFASRRTMQFTVRRANTGEPRFAHRIETWTSNEGATRAVRVTDSSGRLLAGRWTDRGQATVMALGTLDDVWQTDLSAAAFRDHYAVVGSCNTTVRPDVHVITCARTPRVGLLDALVPPLHAQDIARDVSRAEIVLRRRDLHSTRLTLVVPLDGVEHLVTLEEESLSLVPAAGVPANAFVPEPTAARAPLSRPSPSSRSVATPSLEVRLVELIDRVAPRESLSVRQTDTRAFLVEGIVSTPDQRRAVLDGIAAFRAGGSVSAEIVTFEEVARDQSSESANGATRAQVLESTVGAAPVESWVRARVAPDADPMAILRELTPLVMTASGAIRRHALALSALTDRFDEATVAQLDEDGRAAWRTLLERHAAASLAALNSVDTALAPYFDHRRVDPEPAPETPGMAAHRLVDVAGAIDRAIVAAFARSGERSTMPLDVLDVRDDIQNARALAQIVHALASSSRQTPREIAP